MRSIDRCLSCLVQTLGLSVSPLSDYVRTLYVRRLVSPNPGTKFHANGPVRAIINDGNPQTVDLHDHPWYQTTTKNCSPSIIPT
jgi:hypothetical protein